MFRKGNGRRKIVLPNTEIEVFIRDLSAAEARDYAERAKALNADPDSNLDLLAHGVILGVVDKQGAQMFTADDADAIKNSMSIGTLRYISEQIGRLSGGDPDDQKKDGASSQLTPSGDSPSSSAAN